MTTSMNLKGQEYKCSVHQTQIWHSMSALACILPTTQSTVYWYG